MMSSASLRLFVKEVLRLDWRLLIAECRANSHDAAVLFAIAAFVVFALCTTALSVAGSLTSLPPPMIGTMVAIYAWGACGMAATLALAGGAYATTERIVTHLSLHPVTRFQAFLLIQTLTLGGRYAVGAAIAALPLLFLLTRVLNPFRFIAVGAALIVVLRLLPGVIRVALWPARALRPQAYFLLYAIGVLIILAWISITGVDAAIDLLPPNVLARVAVNSGSAEGAWALLLLWTLAICALEYLAFSWRGSPPQGEQRSERINAIPAWIARAASLCSVDAPLLHGELLRLVRWRRFVLAVSTALAMAMMFIFRRVSGDEGVLPALLPLMMPLVVMAPIMGNLFAPDGPASQAYFLVLDRPQSAVRAKLAAHAIVNAGMVAVIGMALIGSASPGLHAAHLYLLAAVPALFLWNTASGRVTSILFPTPTDSRGLGGSLIRGAGALISIPANLAFAGAVAGVAAAYDAQWIDTSSLFAVGCFIGMVAVVSAYFAARGTNRVMLARRERFIAALSTGAAVY